MRPDEAVLAHMKNFGLDPGQIKWTGKLERFPGEGESPKKKKGAGWYVAHADRPVNVRFGSWKTGVDQVWWDNGKKGEEYDPALRDEIQAKKDALELEREERAARVAEECAKRWEAASEPSPAHPYLLKKGITTFPNLRQEGGTLLVRMTSFSDGYPTVCLQEIYQDGEKRFVAGARALGARCTIGGAKFVRTGRGDLYIAEGYATGWSINAATGHPVFVAFSTANLVAIATALRARYGPNQAIIIAADNDRWSMTHKGPNPGVIYAQEAAKAADAFLAIPDFQDLSTKPTDYNDLMLAEGLHAVRDWLDPGRADLARIIVEAGDGIPEPPPLEEGSTATPELEQPTGQDALVVPPPSCPMPVARTLVEHLYSETSGLVLHDHRGNFYRYNGSCWPEIDGRSVRADVYRFLEDAVFLKAIEKEVEHEPWNPTRRKIDDALDALRAIVHLEGADPPMWIDGTTAPPASEIVSLENGLLHVPKRTLHQHTPRFFNHHALPFSFDPSAPKPESWLRFLTELWAEDSSSVTALQEVFGYILGGDTRHQKIFLLVGPRRGGKGTIGRVLTGLLGRHNVAAPTLASLSTNFGLQPLIGRPLGLISDARLSGRTDTHVVVERLLSISGEDSLTIDRKYREPWTGRLSTRFMILTNELPRLSDSSGALASRFILFMLTRSFLGREDPGLTNRLLLEAPGIFNWALDGLDRLNTRGHFEPPESGMDALQQLEDLSSPVSAFVRERCSVGPAHRIPVDGLWNAWKQWCLEDNRNPGTKAVFGRDLKAANPGVRKARPREDGDRVMVYEGIGLTPATANTPNGHGDHRDQSLSGHGGHGDRAEYSPSVCEPLVGMLRDI